MYAARIAWGSRPRRFSYAVGSKAARDQRLIDCPSTTLTLGALTVVVNQGILDEYLYSENEQPFGSAPVVATTQGGAVPDVTERNGSGSVCSGPASPTARGEIVSDLTGDNGPATMDDDIVMHSADEDESGEGEVVTGGSTLKRKTAPANDEDSESGHSSDLSSLSSESPNDSGHDSGNDSDDNNDDADASKHGFDGSTDKRMRAFRLLDTKQLKSLQEKYNMDKKGHSGGADWRYNVGAQIALKPEIPVPQGQYLKLLDRMRWTGSTEEELVTRPLADLQVECRRLRLTIPRQKQTKESSAKLLIEFDRNDNVEMFPIRDYEIGSVRAEAEKRYIQTYFWRHNKKT